MSHSVALAGYCRTRPVQAGKAPPPADGRKDSQRESQRGGDYLSGPHKSLRGVANMFVLKEGFNAFGGLLNLGHVLYYGGA